MACGETIPRTPAHAHNLNNAEAYFYTGRPDVAFLVVNCDQRMDNGTLCGEVTVLKGKPFECG